MIKRKSMDTVLEMLRDSHTVYINGARQCGKSTLAMEIASCKNMKYLTFDDPSVFAAAKHDPVSFMKNIRSSVALDEIQMVPEIFRSLKTFVDEQKREGGNLRILLTGSANIMALPQLADALVGRMQILTLYPFSLAEANVPLDPFSSLDTTSTLQLQSAYLSASSEAVNLRVANTFIKKLFCCDFNLSEKLGKNDIVKKIKSATFPEISLSPTMDAKRWFDSYITTLLGRDIKELANIEKIADIPLILKVLANRAGSLINESSMARDCGVNLMTLRRYRILLEHLFVIFRLRPWFRNIEKRLVKSTKSYFIDTYMLCNILGVNVESVQQDNSMLFGHILENFVFTEILKNLDMQTQLFHFRTLDDKEVDFVLEKNNEDLVGIEVKSSATISAGDFAGLVALKEVSENSFKCGVVLYQGENIIPFSDRMFAVPISCLG